MKRKVKIPTVSIGIPAFNEAANIRTLLNTLPKQKGNFVLEKIFVVIDGSTDDTPKIVKELAKKQKIIVVKYDGKRTGKAQRLNQLFAMNSSDFLIVFDADITIPATDLIDKILKRFTDPEIVLVSANNLPSNGKKLWGKITQYSEELWYHARKYYNNGECSFNNSGCSFAIRKSFAKSFTLEPHSVHNQLYIYYEVVKAKKQFRFAIDAIVYYKTPSIWKDILAHHARGKTSPIIENKINQALGYAEHVPMKLQLYSLYVMMKKNPFYTLLAIIYLKCINFVKIDPDPLNKIGLWTTITSSK